MDRVQSRVSTYSTSINCHITHDKLVFLSYKQYERSSMQRCGFQMIRKENVFVAATRSVLFGSPSSLAFGQAKQMLLSAFSGEPFFGDACMEAWKCVPKLRPKHAFLLVCDGRVVWLLLLWPVSVVISGLVINASIF